MYIVTSNFLIEPFFVMLGLSNAISTSASSNSLVHPPPTNILAQHLQRGMAKNNSSTITTINNIPPTVKSHAQTTQGIPSQTSTYPSPSNLPKGSPTFITVGSKPNLASPPNVSTTTLSLINSTGFVPSNANGDQGTYSMASNQQIVPNNQANAVQLQNQQVLSNTMQNQTMVFGASGNQQHIVGGPSDPSQAGRRASYSGGNGSGSITVGSSNVVGAVGAMGPSTSMNPSPQLQGLLMQNPNNPTMVR